MVAGQAVMTSPTISSKQSACMSPSGRIDARIVPPFFVRSKLRSIGRRSLQFALPQTGADESGPCSADRRRWGMMTQDQCDLSLRRGARKDRHDHAVLTSSRCCRKCRAHIRTSRASDPAPPTLPIARHRSCWRSRPFASPTAWLAVVSPFEFCDAGDHSQLPSSSFCLVYRGGARRKTGGGHRRDTGLEPRHAGRRESRGRLSHYREQGPDPTVCCRDQPRRRRRSRSTKWPSSTAS